MNTFQKYIQKLIHIGIPSLIIACLALAHGCQKNIAIQSRDCPVDPGCPDAVNGGDCSRGLVITVCSNHGHLISSSVADNIMKKGPQSYFIKGNADHDHEIYINGGYYFKLQNNEGIQVTSSSKNGHTHRVTINCMK